MATAVGAFFCLGLSNCQPTTVTLTEPLPSTLDVKVTVRDDDAAPIDGKLAVFMKFTSGGKPVSLQGSVQVTCNGHALPFEPFYQSYTDRVPLQPVNGTYHFGYVLKGQASALDVPVPERPVITSPAPGPPNQGPMVVLAKDLTIRYMPGSGTSVDVWASDGKTGVGSSGAKPDNGVFGGFDPTALQPGDGTLQVTRNKEYSKPGTAFKSALISYSSSADLRVTWLLPIDQMLARCPTAAEIASINKDLTFTYDTDPTAPTLVCTAAGGSANLTRLQERTYQALLAMKRIQFDAPLPWTNKSLYTWFVGAVKGIRYQADFIGSWCCGPDGIIQIGFPPDPMNTVGALLTDRWIKDVNTRVGLKGLFVNLVHEARHNEGKPHNCNRPNHLSMPSCSQSNFCDDQTLSELGAWGLQYYLQKWLVDHSDQRFLAPPGPNPQFYRTVTDYDAAWILKDRFCSEP